MYIYIYSILGFHSDNGKENGNYCLGFRDGDLWVPGLGFRDILGSRFGSFPK